jgi:hypothetical protein
MSSFHHYAKIAKKILNESENKIDTASNLYFSDIDEKIFISKSKDFAKDYKGHNNTYIVSLLEDKNEDTIINTIKNNKNVIVSDNDTNEHLFNSNNITLYNFELKSPIKVEIKSKNKYNHKEILKQEISTKNIFFVRQITKKEITEQMFKKLKEMANKLCIYHDEDDEYFEEIFVGTEAEGRRKETFEPDGFELLDVSFLVNNLYLEIKEGKTLDLNPRDHMEGEGYENLGPGRQIYLSNKLLDILHVHVHGKLI